MASPRVPAELPRELVRRLRGTIAQKDLSRLLGYPYNVVSKWESGRTKVGWADFVGILKRAEPRGLELISRYFNLRTSEVRAPDRLVRAFRDREREVFPTKYGMSAQAATRILEGRRLLWLNEALTLFYRYSEVNFLFLLEDLGMPRQRVVARLPSLARFAEYPSKGLDNPWIPVVLAAIELDEYKKLGRHVPGYFSRLLGFPREMEDEIREALLRHSLIAIEGGKWTLGSGCRVFAPRRGPGMREPLLLFATLARKFLLERYTGERNPSGDFFVRFMAMSRVTFDRMRSKQLDSTNRLNEIREDPGEPKQTIGVFGGFALDLRELLTPTSG